jgi:uncharacterized membrane protein YkoI
MRNFLICLCVTSLLLLPSCAALSREHEDEEKEEGHEVKVKIDQLPAAARTTIEDQTKGGTIEDIAKVSDDGKTFYEADVKMADGKEYEVQVGEDGKLISRKQEHDDEKGKEDKEDNK